MDETEPKFNQQEFSEQDQQMSEIPTSPPKEKVEGFVKPELLSGTDFLGIEPKLKEMGYEVSVYNPPKIIMTENVMMIPESVMPDKEKGKLFLNFPHVSRSLSLAPTSDKTPEREPDRRVEIGGYKHYVTWMWDEWQTQDVGNSIFETYVDEGVLSHTSPEGDSRSNYTLPTRKMDRPAYFAGDAHNIWLSGGGTLAEGISPVRTNCWFTRANPNFCQYLERTRDKLESISRDEIIRYHMDIAQRCGVTLNQERLRNMADRYCETELPIIMESIQGLLEGTDDIRLPSGRNRYRGFEDGIWLFISTTKPVLPLSSIVDEPTPEMNVKYETAMMKELDDPEASKLNWLDIATAFSVECGPARTTYLCIDPKTWEEKCAELVTKLEAERIEEEEFFTALEKLPMNILKNLRKFSRSANSWEPLRKSDSDLLEAIHRYWKGKRQMPDLSLLNDE